MTSPSGTVAARYAGTRVPRVEDTRLLTGHGTFVDDITRPGMLHACFVRSPFARARINGIDASAALELPGVHAVFTAADLNPDVKESWHAVVGKDIADTPRPPLAEGEVKFVGDPVALVVAENRYIAEDAIELVDVDYEPLPAIADFTKAVGSDVVVHEAYPDNVAGGMARRRTRRRFRRPRMWLRRMCTSRSTRRCRSRREAWSSSGKPPQAY
jgi:aerobic carbon-monoxide dehydrogenase large subunit